MNSRLSNSGADWGTGAEKILAFLYYIEYRVIL